MILICGKEKPGPVVYRPQLRGFSFPLFYLSSICVQSNIFGLYGYADYGAGAYWMTIGNVMFFGILFGVLFRLPRFSLRIRWVFRLDRTFIWIIILAILVVFMGLAWEALTKEYVPAFPSPVGRVPDIAVVWTFALGYFLGRNIEQKRNNHENQRDN